MAIFKVESDLAYAPHFFPKLNPHTAVPSPPGPASGAPHSQPFPSLAISATAPLPRFSYPSGLLQLAIRPLHLVKALSPLAPTGPGASLLWLALAIYTAFLSAESSLLYLDLFLILCYNIKKPF